MISLIILYIFPLVFILQSLGTWEGIVYTFLILPWFIICIVWWPIYFKSIRYEIGANDIKTEEGVWWKKKNSIPYEKITNVDTIEGPFERMFNIGKVLIQTAGKGTQIAEGALVGIKNHLEVKEEIMKRVNIARGKVDTSVTYQSQRSTFVPHPDTSEEYLKKIHEELQKIRETLEKQSYHK